MGIWGLALAMNPLIAGPAAEQAEAAIGASQNAALMSLCPLAGVTLQALDVVLRNNGVQHPLFKPANDNAQAAYDLPDDWFQLVNLGAYVVENPDTEDPQLAVQALEKAGKIDPIGTEDYYLQLGKAYLAVGNGYGAAQAFSAYLETNPNDQDVLELRVQANRMDLSVLDADGDGSADNESDAEDVKGLQQLLLADEAVLVNNDIQEQYNSLQDLENELVLADVPSEEEGLQVLEGVEAMANRYMILGSVTVDDPENQEALRANLNSLASRSYDVAAAYAESSPYEEVSKRAPLYKALSLLAQGEIDTAEVELKKIRSDFPEAEAIVSRMEGDRRRDVNKQALEVWKNFIDERERQEISDHNSILGHTAGFATWAASGGEETGISRCHDKWNLQRDVLDAVEKKLNKGDAKTLKAALQAVVDEGDGRLSGAAQTLLNDVGNTGWGTGYRLDAVSFLVGYTDALESGDAEAAGDFANHLYENADHLTIMDGAAKTAYGLYGLLEATSGDEAFAAKCGEKMTELETGNKTIAGFIWDEIRTTGTDDLAAMAIMGGAAKIGRSATFKAYRFLRKAGIAVTKARYAAIGAGFAAEANALWGMNTLYQASAHDASQVFSADHLLKSYGANLISLGFMKGFGAGGRTIGEAFAAKSPRLQFVLSHSFAMGGMVAGNQTGHALGLSQAPRGGFKQSVIRDVFGYFKYAAGPRVFETVFPAKAAAPQQAPEPVKSEPKNDPLPAQALVAAKQAVAPKKAVTPAVEEAKREEVTRVDVKKSADEATKVEGKGAKEAKAPAPANSKVEQQLLRDLSILQVRTNVKTRNGSPEKFGFQVNRQNGRLDTIDIRTSGIEGYEKVVDALKAKGLSFQSSEHPRMKVLEVSAESGRTITLRFEIGSEAKANAAPGAKAPAAPSPLLPQDALYSISGPAGLYGLLTAHGVPQSVALLVSGAALAIPVLGMVWGGSRPKPQPIVPNANGTPVAVQDSPSSPARLVVAPTRNGGLILFDGPIGTPRGGVTVNGRPMTYEWLNGMAVKPGDVIEADGRSYEIAPSYPQSANVAALQAGNQGYPPAPAPSAAPGQSVRVRGQDGRTILVAIEGSGRAPGQRTADAEAQAAMSDWIRQGYGLDQVVPGGRLHVQQAFLKADGSVRGGAPKLDAAGVELIPVAEGYQASFVRNGAVEAAVIRLGDAKEAIFQAPEGKSSPEKPLRDGDVVVMGRFAEGLNSMWIVRDIIRKTGTQSPEAIQAALVQEARIRAELRKIVPADHVIEHRHYAQAYERVTGRKPDFGYAGYYEAGHVLKANGDVVSTRDGKVVDRFPSEPMAFQVQVVGK
ncbi:MAG TPA: hypothetical protein VLJ37_04800 [bacterium]|nr:hypothetical protein [bacterium]